MTTRAIARRWFAVFAFCAVAGSTRAADKGCIVVTNSAEIEQAVTDSAGLRTMKLVPAVKVVPGDTVVYTIAVRNVCNEPAEGVSVDNPVPNHMAYVADSAIGPNTDIRFSIDGGYKFGKPGELRKRDADGSERSARPAEYTSIRWVMRHPLAAGAEAYMRFRAVLE